MVRCCLCLLFVYLLPAYAQGNDLQDYLQGYEGRWVGDYSLHSTANGFTEIFAVEQRYWWEGEVLHGSAVSRRNSGMVKATSKTWVDGKNLVTEVKRGESKEAFYGVLLDGGVLWLPVDLRRANDYQMRESFTQGEGGERKMIIEGFDSYVYAEGLAHIIIKGELTRRAVADDAD